MMFTEIHGKDRGWRAVEQPDRRTLVVDLYYPRNDDTRISRVEVGLMDVRATDNVRVSYDFDRDGWKIEQAQVFEWNIDDQVCDPEWSEVAFIRAWGRKR